MKYVLKTTTPTRAKFDWDSDLNREQRAAVEAPAEPLLVLAGAGTGKTRTLTYRVARFIAAGTPPERLLLCTFTNRAAKEMVDRVAHLVGIDMQRAFAGTFHHVANRLLRRFAEHVGLSADFGILDTDDASTLLSAIMAERPKALATTRFPDARVLLGLIGLSAGMERPLAEVLVTRAPKLTAQHAAIVEVAAAFAARKRAMNVCDFDDLLVHWKTLLTDEVPPPVAETLRGMFDHVLVDEYQDVNHLQGTLCDLMAARSQSLTCVGDDAQSIYAFRGADYEQILRFRQRHPEARIVELTTNYRSTPEILELANRCLRFNTARYEKNLTSVRPRGALPGVVPLRDVYQQAEFIAQRVLELHHDRQLPLRHFAVLYRNHNHSLELQVELTRRNIPFAVRSGLRFFEQAHIKDVLSYLRVRDNVLDELSWRRLLTLWPGIGQKTADELTRQIVNREAGLPSAPDEVLADRARAAKDPLRSTLERVIAVWRGIAATSDDKPGDVVRSVLTAHYGEYIDRTFGNAAERREDLEHLARYADHRGAARELLAEVALAQGIGAEVVRGGNEPEDKLILSTVHQAKGLEWPVCFVIGLTDGRFPSAHALRSRSDLEEERRLFYVACTRAADELTLGYPTVEEGRDGRLQILRPSRFLVELDYAPAVFERWQIQEEPL